MKWFGKDKKNATPLAPEDRAHPMEAVPERIEGVESRVTDNGERLLRARVPPAHAIERWMARVAGTEKTVRVALDEHGAFFWDQIDGRKNLFALSAALRKRFRLSSEESERGAILFVKMLMRRQLIRLRVHPRRGAGRQGAVT